MEHAVRAKEPPVDVADPTLAASADKASLDPKSTPKRKRQLCGPAEVDTMRPPRLSPEPQDDPEAAKRVKEKNRLRLYRFNKSLEKRKSSDGGAAPEVDDGDVSPPPSPAKPPAQALEGGVSRPVAVSGGVSKPPRPQAANNTGKAAATLGVSRKRAQSVPPIVKGNEDDDKSSKPNPRAPPRLSPEPEGATPQEAKRVRAKNRLRVYRYRQAQKKLAGGEAGATACSPPPESDSDPEPEEASRQVEHSQGDRRAFHRYQDIQPDLGRSSEPRMSALGQLDAATLAAMAQISASGGVLPHGLPHPNGPALSAAAAQFLTGSAPQDAPPKKAPKEPKPPRMSPEPEDPKDAKRVRSKNRVRMHRYHQSLAAAQAAAEEKHSAVPSSMETALRMAASQAPPYGSPYQFPGFPDMRGQGEDWRTFMENQRLSSFLQDADMLRMRPNYRASDPGSLAAGFQAPPAKRQTTGNAKGKSAATFAAPPPVESFPATLKTIPFGEMTPVLRELALDTYIKETMGMANSLQQLEDQLRAAARHGDTGLQSTALLAAVSQLREDSLGLSRLRMQQYADLVQQSTSIVGQAIMKNKRRSAPGDAC